MYPVSHITVEDEVNYLKRRAASLGYKLTKLKPHKKGQSDLPYSKFPNFGKSWSQPDVEYLVKALNDGVPLEKMVQEVGRTPGAILGKLGACAELWYDTSQRGYSFLKWPKKGQLYMSYKSIKALEEKYGW